MIRLLAIDVDGTLLDGRGRIPDANRDALAAAAGRGIEVALVTGRSYHFALPVARALGIPLTLVVNNGAVVKDADGMTHLRHLLRRDVAREVVLSMAEYEDSVALVFDRPDERQIVFERMDWTHPNRRGYYDRNRPFIADAGGALADALVEDPIQVMFNGGVRPMRDLVDALRAHPSAAQFSVAITEYEARDFSLIDVNGAGCSKGATLARWAARRGVPPDQVLAAGDNLNDVEMLDFAGTAVVMGNATDALKARFPRAHVAPSNDEDGLAAALAQLVTRQD